MMFATTKELILVRDPRDVVASQRSYFKTLRDSHVQEIIRYCAQYVDFTSRDPADTLVIKYENLVCDWSVQLQRISNFIGVEIPEERRELVDKTFAAHARSSSPESSIGRWRTELSKDDRTTIETLCGPFMERFSYL